MNWFESWIPLPVTLTGWLRTALSGYTLTGWLRTALSGYTLTGWANTGPPLQ